ncbi:MAG: chromate transporter [bacterium]|nr:MAG: chromate transporter [bacterium]
MGIYWEMFVTFLRIGVLGFGGGPAFIPLIEKEVVHHHGWLTMEEFIDVLAMANTLPGPISTKLALCVGLKMGGATGAVVSLVGLLLPSSIAVIVIALFYYRYRHLPTVQGIVRGVRPVVVALLMVVVAHVAPRSVLTWDTFLIALVTFVVVFYFRIHPAITILCAAAIGLLFYR